MAEICIANDVLLVSDEIHSDLIFHGKKHTPTATLSPEIAGQCDHLRVRHQDLQPGWSAGVHHHFPESGDEGRYSTSSGVNMDIHRNNAFSSVAMEAAYRRGRGMAGAASAVYLRRTLIMSRNTATRTFLRIKPNVPDATYLVWLDCRELGMEQRGAEKLYDREGQDLGLNEGYTFGRSLTGYMRLNAACPRSVLEKAMKQLKDAVDAL